MRIDGYCYKHSCPLQAVPISGWVQMVCPQCIQEQRLYTANTTSTQSELDSKPIQFMGKEDTHWCKLLSQATRR